MAYFAQVNYSDKMGNGPFEIKQIGCFVTAFSNLLEKFNLQANPSYLNAYFTEHNIYMADPADGTGVRDDLAWSSVTAYDSSVNVDKTGSGGWPASDNAIVEFRYSHNGHQVTHFCAIASAVEHTIIDSLDGVVKQPGIYGEPVAYAMYERSMPRAVPVPAPSAALDHPLNAVPGPGYDGMSITVQPSWGLAQAAHLAGFADWDTSSRWGQVAALNGYISSDWEKFNASLQPGQRIKVGTPAKPVPVAMQNVRVITVVPGWGLERVAAAAGRTDASKPSVWQQIAELNGSKDWDSFNHHLQPGQLVKVPLQGGHGEGEASPAWVSPRGHSEVEAKLVNSAASATEAGMTYSFPVTTAGTSTSGIAAPLPKARRRRLSLDKLYALGGTLEGFHAYMKSKKQGVK